MPHIYNTKLKKIGIRFFRQSINCDQSTIHIACGCSTVIHNTHTYVQWNRWFKGCLPFRARLAACLCWILKIMVSIRVDMFTIFSKIGHTPYILLLSCWQFLFDTDKANIECQNRALCMTNESVEIWIQLAECSTKKFEKKKNCCCGCWNCYCLVWVQFNFISQFLDNCRLDVDTKASQKLQLLANFWMEFHHLGENSCIISCLWK